ncbi:hypothetical protein FOMA001_g19521 [Fusarium oxysporum f. sp. matthiolae]|nr:hypothetical protein FOMA001_g19521 [Fusarium oxysporum f. sp. matthiolae]
MSSASPAPLLSEPSDELLGPASPGSPVPAKRTLDRSPSDRAGKRAKGREKARDTSYHEIWYCKHCDSTKKPNSITTNLSRARKHLRDFHGIRVIEHVERSDLKKQQHGTITDLFGRQEERQAHRDLNAEKYLANAINIPAFEEALARLLAVRNIAHTFIEYPEFHAVILSCNYMARDVLLRSRRAVPKLLKKTFAQHKQGLVKKLHNSLSSMVHFTIDMWTSSEQKAAYQAIVVHFVDAETRGVAQALLSLREFKGSHNGKLQAKAFLEVVEEYDLKGKVGYFTMDNHDANDTMLDDIAKEIDGLDPVARRLRCSGHIMNLIVQAFLFRTAVQAIRKRRRGIITKAQATEEWREFSVLGKLHNLCIYSRSSTSIYNDFKAEIGRALPRDNDTRWNSWFRLIDVAIEKRAKFMDWIQENHAKIEKDALDHNDWNELGDIHAFLQVFHQISVRQGRENTLDEVLSHMDFLHHHFTRTKNRAFSGPRFYARFHVAWLKFEKYYQLTEQAPVYVAGILLHSALRKSYLSEQWKRNPAWVSNAVKAVRKIWSTEYKSYQLPDEQQEKGQELDEFDRWRQKVYSTASEVKDEFDRFIYGSQVGIGQQTALQWWLEPTQREKFPLLCRMAIDIFCIPPMSTEAERIFSGARRQVRWDRSSMSTKMVEAGKSGSLGDTIRTVMDKCWFVLSQTHYPPPREADENGAFKQTGPLCLGHFIKNLKHLDHLINRGGPEPFPRDMPVYRTGPIEFEWESNKEGGFDVSMGASMPIAAAPGINANASLGFALKKTVGNSWQIEQLETLTIEPTRAYVNRCLASEQIVEFLEDNKFGPTWSIFMITGLKIVRGNSTQNTSHGRERGIKGGPGVGVAGFADVSVEGISSSATSTSTAAKHTHDFVWAVRLSKITKGLFDKKWSQKTYSKGATFDMKKSETDIESILSDEGLAPSEILTVGADEAGLEHIVVPVDANAD